MIPAPSLRRARPGLGLLLAVVSALALLAHEAEARTPAAAADPWEDARALYRAERFDEAIPFIVEGIQRQPDRAELYLGLARTFFQAGRLDEAVWYYDLYLREFAADDSADATRRRERERVLAERSSANAAREDAERAPALPPAQDAARERFVQRLTDGPIVAARGAGAEALWTTLLRTGYARPDLAALRAQLAAAARAEARTFLHAGMAALPAADLQEWELQRTRLRLALDLIEAEADTADRSLDEAALHFVDGQLALLNDAPETAQGRFASSVQRAPTFLPARLGLLNALLAQDSPDRDAVRDALRGLREGLGTRDGAEGIAVLYEAAAAHVLGQASESAVQVDNHLRAAQRARIAAGVRTTDN